MEQYTSVYSLEVVLYCVFNVRLKRHKHLKAVDYANVAVGTSGSFELNVKTLSQSILLYDLLTISCQLKFSQLWYTLPHFLIKDVN